MLRQTIDKLRLLFLCEENLDAKKNCRMIGPVHGCCKLLKNTLKDVSMWKKIVTSFNE